MTPKGGVIRCAQMQMALPRKIFPVIVALDETQGGVPPFAALKMVPDDGNLVALDIDRDPAACDTFK